MTMSSTIYGGLRAVGVPAAHRLIRNAGVVLCYHNVAPPSDCALGEPGLHMPVGYFERQMCWLARHYRVVSLREFVDRMTQRQSLRRLAAITFDDGYAGVYQHAVPVLDALNLPATVFIVGNAAGSPRPFWWDHPHIVAASTPAQREKWLKDCRGDGQAIGAPLDDSTVPDSHQPAGWPSICAALPCGIDVGAHSLTHRCLTELTDVELEEELAGSRDVVCRHTGATPDFFAYPYGRADARMSSLLRSHGYRGGFTLRTGLNDTASDPWCLARVNVPAHISEAAFEAWTAAIGTFWRS
jgi:peptidoglycan/xylan/chitin deacetylase (PgdA/CDA1 family)